MLKHSDTRRRLHLMLHQHHAHGPFGPILAELHAFGNGTSESSRVSGRSSDRSGSLASPPYVTEEPPDTSRPGLRLLLEGASEIAIPAEGVPRTGIANSLVGFPPPG